MYYVLCENPKESERTSRISEGAYTINSLLLLKVMRKTFKLGASAKPSWGGTERNMESENTTKDFSGFKSTADGDLPRLFQRLLQKGQEPEIAGSLWLGSCLHS